MKEKHKADLKIHGEGTIFMVHPQTERGRRWIEETAPVDAQFLGNAMAVENRYLEGVIEAAIDAGLILE